MTAGPIALYRAFYTQRPPRLNLDFINGQPLDPRITFTRASSAMRYNSAGVLESLTNDVPRFDYDPVTLAPKGLLIEAAVTNAQVRSQEFDNASWTKTNVTVAANSVVGADGTTTADTLTASAGNGTTLGSVATTAVSWTFSVWLRRLTGTGNIDITMDGTTWSTVAVTTTLTRFSVTQTAVAGTSTPGIRIVTNADAVYAWGAQAETGANLTSYIPTVEASATRAIEIASMTGVNFSQWFNPVEGAFIIDLMRGNNLNGPVALFASDGTLGEYHTITLASSLRTSAKTVDGAVTTASPVSATNVALLGQFSKIAYAYRLNDFGFSTNGGTAITDTSGTLPTVDRLHIGSDFSGGVTPLGGWIKTLKYYDTRLPDERLVRLTS